MELFDKQLSRKHVVRPERKYNFSGKKTGMDEAFREAMGKAGDWEPNLDRFTGSKEKRQQQMKDNFDSYQRVHGQAFGTKVNMDNFKVLVVTCNHTSV